MNIQRIHHTSIRALLTLLTLGSVCYSTANAQPRWQWIVPITGQTFDEGLDMGIGPDGNVHVVGQFSDSLHVDTNLLMGFNGYDGFSARLSSNGKVLDYDAYGGMLQDELRSIAVDNKGNYYVAGTFEDQAIIGGATIESIEPFTIDMYLAKFDKTGVLQWTQVFGAPDFDEPPPYVAVDSLGNVYLAGGFGKTAQFGTKSVTSTGSNDIFIAKVSTLGEVTWVKRAGSTKSDFATDVAVSPNGDRVYVVGNFSGSVNFGGSQPLESYAGEQDMFAWALSADGSYQWVKRIGYQGKDNSIFCSSDASGRLLTTGGMMQTTTFGEESLKANGEFEPDVFVCRFTKTGSTDLLNRFGGTFKDVGMAITSNSQGAIYITGQFDTTTTLGSTVLMSHGALDMFVMRLWPNGDAEWAQGAGGKFDDVGTGVVVGADGVPYVCGTFDTEAWFGADLIVGERFSDAFVAALECGPNTELKPPASTVTVCANSDSIVYAPNGYDTYQWYANGMVQSTPKKAQLNLGSLPEGNHDVYVEIMDAYGCIGVSDTIHVTVTPGLPEPIVTKLGNVLSCSIPDVQYQWYWEGTPIAGGTNQNQELVGDGLYKVLISDNKGCSRFSANFIVGSTSVAGNELESLNVWPNPFTNAVTISGAANAVVTVSDVLGNVLAERTCRTNIEQFHLSVASGTYLVTVRTPIGSQTVMLVKQP